jgi:hypothetical protein
MDMMDLLLDLFYELCACDSCVCMEASRVHENNVSRFLDLSMMVL